MKKGVAYLYPLNKGVPYLYLLNNGVVYIYPLNKGVAYLYPLNKGVAYLYPLNKGATYLYPLNKDFLTLSRGIDKQHQAVMSSTQLSRKLKEDIPCINIAKNIRFSVSAWLDNNSYATLLLCSKHPCK